MSGDDLNRRVQWMRAQGETDCTFDIEGEPVRITLVKPKRKLPTAFGAATRLVNAAFRQNIRSN